MKQVVFSFPEQKVPVVCIYYGDITDDGFKPVTDMSVLSSVFSEILDDVDKLIHYDKYFNNVPFIEVEDFDSVFQSISRKTISFSYYPNLLVCTLKPDDYGTEKEES